MDIVISRSEEETLKAGEKFGRQLDAGSLVALYGDLGAGKTQFVKGVCRAFNVEEVVNSPTFTIVNEYHGTMPVPATVPPAEESVPVFHIDLYRMNNLNDIMSIGFDEYLEQGGVCLVEWAEKLQDIIPERRYDVKMSVVDDTTREIAISRMSGKDR